MSRKFGTAPSALDRWAYRGGKKYVVPASASFDKLPAAVYEPKIENGSLILEVSNFETDDLYDLPDTPSVRILDGIRKFWAKKTLFEELRFAYQRGVLMAGPPGTGKTATISIMCRDLIASDGLVFYATDFNAVFEAIKQTRNAEPERPLIVVLEDLEAHVKNGRARDILALLDGEAKITNVVYLATTNNLNALDARFTNRPSRFDEIVHFKSLSPAARKAYLERALPGIYHDRIDEFVSKTDGLNVAHLRELIVANVVLERDVDEVVARLRAMDVKRKVGMSHVNDAEEEPQDFSGLTVLERGHRLLACGELAQSGRSVKQEPAEATTQGLALV